MKTILRSENALEILDKNKDLLLSPRYASLMPDIVEILSKKQEHYVFIRENFDRIKNCTKIDKVIKIYEQIEHLYPEEYEKHRFVFDQIYNPAMEMLEKQKNNAQNSYSTVENQILKTCSTIIIQDKTKDIESFLNAVKMMLNDDKIEIIGAGSFSIVLKTGGKILKIGGERAEQSSFEIPNHPRLIRPIIRKKDISVDPNNPLYIELQDEVDTNTEISDEELLQVYKELREAGLTWPDAAKRNLGRLKADNYGYPIGYGPPANNESLGIVGKDTLNNVLKKGDLVIIDLDLIYPEEHDIGFEFNVPDFIIEFEKEFQRKKKEDKENNKDYGEK